MDERGSPISRCGDAALRPLLRSPALTMSLPLLGNSGLFRGLLKPSSESVEVLQPPMFENGNPDRCKAARSESTELQPTANLFAPKKCDSGTQERSDAMGHSESSEYTFWSAELEAWWVASASVGPRSIRDPRYRLSNLAPFETVSSQMNAPEFLVRERV